jgi:D-glycero-D-manno-heptose 1,7-bisphosphate phosphatase
MRNKTLFLDRDGVINTLRVGRYVATWSDFAFEPGFPEALVWLRDYFHRIVIITNQQGIGKGLMTPAQLDRVHEEMLRNIQESGGGIDGIVVCPHLAEEQCSCRKPAPGMLLHAQMYLPGVSCTNAYFLGDSIADMEAARTAGCIPVWKEHAWNSGKKPDWVKFAIHHINEMQSILKIH